MSNVLDFEKQLIKRAGRQFAQWQKIDLHNHTPASFDYRGDKSTAAEATADAINKQGLAAVMFTDHACLPEPAFIEVLRKKTPALILRGTELNVVVDAWDRSEEKVGKNLYFHLLIGFNPGMAQSEDYWLQNIYRKCGEQQIDCGGKKLKAIEKNLDFLVGALEGSGAIVIPSHLHSGSDAYKSRSIDKIYTDAPFLKFAREHFSALEVSHRSTAAFFDGTRVETGCLHKACVMSSDSHEAKELGTCPSYAQMEEATFDELKAALELPFRISLDSPAIPQSYIVGAHIEGVFLRDCWISFSPYCNVLIGVKGSGKTSVLECIRYALGVEVPTSRVDEVRKHLDAILGSAGRVRVLVKRADGAKLLIERSIANQTFQVTLDDNAKHTFQNREGFQFPAHVLGWHEIEHVAVEPQIRQMYLNKISGEAELRRLDEDVKTATSQIRQKHEVAVGRLEQIRSLEIRIERLEELQKGLKALTDENLIELKEKYERGVSDNASVSLLVENLQKLPPTLRQRVVDLLGGISATQFLGAELLKPAVERAQAAISGLVGATADIANDLEKKAIAASDEAGKAKEDAAKAFETIAIEYRESVAKLSSDQQQLLESHIKIAEETRQLQSIRAQHAELRGQTEAILSELRDLCGVVVGKMDERTNLRNEKVSKFSDDLRSSGVRLTVVPYAAKWRFESVAQTFSRSWQLYQEIRKEYSGPSRFHELLRDAYADLAANGTQSKYANILKSADLGPMLDAYEEDDLAIVFDPRSEVEGTRADAQYRPIDQLSAGQRCTAIFPILLKLENAPLLIDQPEDNLDNRHIATKIASSVSEGKKQRQMLFTSHNANLVVLSDPEKIITFEADKGVGTVDSQGFLSHPGSKIMPTVLDILDGGERALELRATKYGRPRK